MSAIGPGLGELSAHEAASEGEAAFLGQAPA
jgi:hypothetical protein